MTPEYLCLTIRSQPDESEPNFKTRLSVFWTLMLRHHPEDFEKVYAETTAKNTLAAIPSLKVLQPGVAKYYKEIGAL